MDSIKENTVRQEQVGSMGRLMAGLAHDMTNHLGIIRESNGLIEDVLGMGVFDEEDVMVERLKKSIAAIERRVVISANMMHHLSGLARRLDTPRSSFLVNDLIEEEHTFLEHFSRLRQVEVVFEFGESLTAVYNDPALFQHVFYRVYTLCLEQMRGGSCLIIITEQEGQDTVIRFCLPRVALMHFDLSAETPLQAAIEKLEGTLESGESGDDTVDVRLKIPSLMLEEMS